MTECIEMCHVWDLDLQLSARTRGSFYCVTGISELRVGRMTCRFPEYRILAGSLTNTTSISQTKGFFSMARRNAELTAKKMTTKITTGTAPKDNSRQLAPRCAMQAYHHGTPAS